MKQIELDFSDHDEAVRVFNEAFCHPDEAYVVKPADTAVALDWLRKNAWATNFAWCAGAKTLQERCAEVGALRKKQVIHMDTLYYRDRCGWRSSADGDNNGYLCDFPAGDGAEVCSETGLRLCHTYQCPIAYEADRDDIKKLYPDLWESDYKDYPDEEPEGWMVLHSRPRYAFVPNVTVEGVKWPT